MRVSYLPTVTIRVDIVQREEQLLIRCGGKVIIVQKFRVQICRAHRALPHVVYFDMIFW
jgi:hypothetical protein